MGAEDERVVTGLFEEEITPCFGVVTRARRNFCEKGGCKGNGKENDLYNYYQSQIILGYYS